jgi:predicted lipoprotein with Yx(FWY)xxD motif
MFLKLPFMKRNLVALTPVLFIVFFFSSCKKNNNTPPRTDIHIDSSAVLGNHIVDKDGKSLYYFSNDVKGVSNCTGSCLTDWPVFYADSISTTFSSDLQAADFKTTTTASGTLQTTYKGWPLYHYAPAGIAESAGQTTGDGIGNVWFAAKTNYSITVANNQLVGLNGISYLSNYTPGTGLTNYLCDEKGHTLYFFAKDSAYKNKFTKTDFSNNATFPIYESTNITVPSTMDKSLFVVVPFNGKNQLTYKGWPLYYYGADSLVRGATKAVTFPPTQPPGAIWPVATKDVVPAPR